MGFRDTQYVDSDNHQTPLYTLLKLTYSTHSTVLIEIIVFPSLHLNKNAPLLMIRNDVFTGTVSASTPLSTQRRFAFVIILKFKYLSFKL